MLVATQTAGRQGSGAGCLRGRPQLQCPPFPHPGKKEARWLRRWPSPWSPSRYLGQAAWRAHLLDLLLRSLQAAASPAPASSTPAREAMRHSHGSRAGVVSLGSGGFLCGRGKEGDRMPASHEEAARARQDRPGPQPREAGRRAAVRIASMWLHDLMESHGPGRAPVGTNSWSPPRRPRALPL